MYNKGGDSVKNRLYDVGLREVRTWVLLSTWEAYVRVRTRIEIIMIIAWLSLCLINYHRSK